MRKAITVRLSDELAEWLEGAAGRLGVSQVSFIREQLERARRLEDRPFLKLAGNIEGPADL